MLHSNKKNVLAAALLGLLCLTAAVAPADPELTPDMGLSEVYRLLEIPLPEHAIDQLDPKLVQVGEDYVLKGKSRRSGFRGSVKQSKHFNCTHCHNIQREDPDLSKPDPEARLRYVVDKGMPFLQGSPLYGVVNRDSWYNDDYLVKYGDLVKEARSNLKASIQLCATECSQGRAFSDEEMEALMHYLWSIEIKLGDLELEERELAELRTLRGMRAINWLKIRFYPAAGAHFADPLPLKERGKLSADVESGGDLFEHSCLHCHGDGKTTNLQLSTSLIDMKFLRKHLNQGGPLDVYEIVRKGTYAIPGYKPYMPHYPLEKMSDQQLEDLVAYIKQDYGKE